MVPDQGYTVDSTRVFQPSLDFFPPNARGCCMVGNQFRTFLNVNRVLFPRIEYFHSIRLIFCHRNGAVLDSRRGIRFQNENHVKYGDAPRAYSRHTIFKLRSLKIRKSDYKTRGNI